MVAAGPSTLYVFGGCGAEGRLADLHKVELAADGTASAVWTNLGSSDTVKGRGGYDDSPLSLDRLFASPAGM